MEDPNDFLEEDLDEIEDEEDMEEEEFNIDRAFQDYVEADTVILIINGEAKNLKCSGEEQAKNLLIALRNR